MSKKPLQEDKSRSQMKREYGELKDLAKQLAALSRGQLRAVPMSDDTRDALLATHAMPRNALHRQYRYLASLLVEEDIETIRAGLAGELRPHSEEVDAFHEMEQWRDRLLSDGPGALDEFVQRYPGCDLEQLRLLIKSAGKERDLNKPPRSARQLFRYLRQLSETED
ncbi:MAG: DUF615 domain-containing protein [Acidobacteria bacterium]|uniref:DUF615 domain-containing protein n=1 Tax=Candidatus Polarisedimenticola svalbardensis TaxID=2886004 RepID=A0A8J6Y1R6_9BACT|nr:DUF615 domain-containing protein [Candidatus Polarisedimenticola svalbardensis]